MSFLFYLLVGIVSIVVYMLFIHDYELNWKSKLVHYLVTFNFWFIGVSKGKLNRELMNKLSKRSPAGENDGVITTNVLVPHYKLKDTTVRTLMFQKKNSLDDTLVIFIHGGGFVFGMNPQHDGLCHRLSKKGMAVLSIDYSLAPEHRFPIAVHECYSVLVRIKESLIQYKKYVIMGDSAGGNLAAVCAMMNRDEKLGLPISLQVLVYPYFFATEISNSEEYYVLSQSALRFFGTSYLNEKSELQSKYANPTRSENGLKNLPPCLLISAEYDPLKHDSDVYKEIMQKDGGSLTHLHYNNIHGFLTFTWLNHSQECFDKIVNAIKSIK